MSEIKYEHISEAEQVDLYSRLCSEGYNFFTGVPDSCLKEFCKRLESEESHIVATWEAEAVGIAVGAMLGGKKACVYMQNSGLGYCINALASLCIPYNVKPMLVIGHRHVLKHHEVMGKADEAILRAIGWKGVIFVDNEK